MTSPFTTICFFIACETIRLNIAVRLFRERYRMMSHCGHQWHLAASRVSLFCTYHAHFDGICERNDIFITNPCLFWPVPIVLVSKTERNSQRHASSGVMKNRVRFGSGREMKKLISQHDPNLTLFFTMPLLSCPRLFRSVWLTKTLGTDQNKKNAGIGARYMVSFTDGVKMW